MAVNRFYMGDSWGICGRHGEWRGTGLNCPECAKLPPEGPIAVVTGWDVETGVITCSIEDD